MRLVTVWKSLAFLASLLSVKPLLACPQSTNNLSASCRLYSSLLIESGNVKELDLCLYKNAELKDTTVLIATTDSAVLWSQTQNSNSAVTEESDQNFYFENLSSNLRLKGSINKENSLAHVIYQLNSFEGKCRTYD